ncbi:MAG: hypothetical protein IIB08_06385 [Bacteroidetes bacterium]|nr:hypothetical protein [Bacteroidota bacterium]
MENKIDRVICEAFGLDEGLFVPVLVEPLKSIDDWLCKFELAALFPNGSGSKFPMAFKVWSPKKARRKFLKRFHELTDGKWRENTNELQEAG